jgi:hypothetical protein
MFSKIVSAIPGLEPIYKQLDRCDSLGLKAQISVNFL